MKFGTKVQPFSRIDVWWMGAGFGLNLLVSYLLSRGRIFWEDEMLGWMLLRDPSWPHMISAWKMGADGGGVAFYLTGRLWFRLFGPSEVSFRMYSAVCFGLAFCVLWAVLRRFYGRRTVCFALFNTWFFSQPIVTHVAEGRFYGLLMLCTALAIWLLMRSGAGGRVPPALYGLTFAVHAVLITSHLLGIVYSATVLGAMIFLDWTAGRLRGLLYCTVVSTWLLLLFERDAIRASAEVGRPHFWTTQPNLSRWVGAYSAYGLEIAVVLVVLCALLIFSIWRTREDWRAALGTAIRARRPAYVISAALLLVPVEFFLEGTVGPSLFINRYLMPVAIAQCFLTAEAVYLIDWHAVLGGLEQKVWFGRLAGATFFAVLLFWDLGHVSHTVMPRENYTAELSRRLPKGVPVLCEDAWAFTEIIGRQHDSGVRYTYLLDWPYSVSSSAPRLEVTQYHLMENWKKVGYFSGSIQYRDRFLAENPRFLIFHQEPGPGATTPPFIGNPLLERFKEDRAYEVLPYGPQKRGVNSDLWMVCRGSCES